MPSNSLPAAIPLYQKVPFDQIENSQVILSFDMLDFKLKPFLWYVFCIDYCIGLNSWPGLWMVTNECHWICGTNMRETPILRNQSRKFRCTTRFIGWLYLLSHGCYRKGCSIVTKQSKLNKMPRVGRLLYQIQATGHWRCWWVMNDKAK